MSSGRVFDPDEMLALTQALRDDLAGAAADRNLTPNDVIRLTAIVGSYYPVVDWAMPTIEYYAMDLRILERSWMRAWRELLAVCANATEAHTETDTAYDFALQVLARIASFYKVLDAMVAYWDAQCVEAEAA